MAARGERMTNDDDGAEGFLGRWSRRKVQARDGRPAPEPAPPPAAPPENEPNQPLVGVDQSSVAIKNEAPAPSLEDVQALTPEADFRPFVARSVAPEVRNAAFRKLFADPHFNVMDGLDIYIDDYSRPDPLTAGTLRQMASARVLRLVQDEPAASTTPAGPAQACADNPPPESSAVPEPPGDMTPVRHAQDPDLRLQPDDAARSETDRPGAA